MENLNIIDKIDSIKDDYTYYTKELTDSNFTSVFGIIYALFELRIDRTRLRKECIELKEEIIASGKNKSIKEENLKKLDTIIIEYDNIVKEAHTYYENYIIIQFFVCLLGYFLIILGFFLAEKKRKRKTKRNY